MAQTTSDKTKEEAKQLTKVIRIGKMLTTSFAVAVVGLGTAMCTSPEYLSPLIKPGSALLVLTGLTGYFGFSTIEDISKRNSYKTALLTAELINNPPENDNKPANVLPTPEVK